jgi:hypothetical protein
MGGFFQVDVDALQSFVTGLHESQEHMQAALDAMKPDEAGSLGAAGSPLGMIFGPISLNQAADRFQHAWHYGLTQISKEIDESTDHVQGCHDAYQACEDDLSKVLNLLNSTLG